MTKNKKKRRKERLKLVFEPNCNICNDRMPTKMICPECRTTSKF